MVQQLMPILVILWTAISANLEEELLQILKTQFQEDNQILMETFRKIPGYNSASVLLHPGFEHLTEENGTEFMDDFMSHLTTDEKKVIISLYKGTSESISSDFLKQLPSVWQSVTLEKTYSLDRTYDWVDVISSEPPDLSLLYSLAKTMKAVGAGADDQVGAGADDQVVVAGLVPPPFLHHFKFLGSHLHAQLIKFLTMDKIKRISKNEDLFALDILKDVWFQVQPGQQEAWYQVFKDSTANSFNGNIKEIENYGFLLGGAPLEDIELLCELTAFKNGHSWCIKLIQETQMNPLRMQAIWDSLNEDDKKLSVSDFAEYLHVTQIKNYYEDHDGRAVSVKEDDLMERKDIPFENILMFSKLDPSPVFVSVLSIPELARFVNTSDWDVETLSKSRLTYGQAMVLYKQWTEENVGHTPVEIPASLLHVVPSQHIQNMYHYHLVLRKHEFIQQSDKMLQSQMSALHKGLRSQLWEKDTMEMILDSHPQCFEAASPAQFRKNLHFVLEALPEVEVSKYDGVLEVARKLRNLPRELQTAWLEAAFQRQQTTGNQYWNTSKLLEVTDDARTAVALLGLNCQQIERIRPSDTMQVLTAYHYLMEIHATETHSPAHIPRHARKCWANKIRTYLKIKSILAEVDVSREVDLLSLLSSAEVKTVGGEILLGWGADVLMTISDENVRNEVVEAVAALPPCHLINNVINFPEVKLLANQNVPHSIHLSDLTRMANFFPYIDGFDKKVTKSDFKLFIQSLSEHERSICTNKQMRESLRKLIVGSFGLPQSLSALDLAQLGDLLIVFNEDDMSRVDPQSLVRANSQLVASASFSRPVPEFLKEVKLVPYFEACRRWLPSNESKEFEAALKRLSDFYTFGSYLSLEAVNNIRSRRKREVSDNSNLWTSTINLLTEWYTNDKLSESQKQMCNQIILAGESTLESRAQNSFDMEFFEATKEITTGLIGTQKQDQYSIKLNKLQLKEIVTQIKYKIVQEVIKLLDWKPSHVKVSRNSFNSAMALSTPIVEDTYNFYLEKHSPCLTASSFHGAKKPDARSFVSDREESGQIPNINYKQLQAKVLQLLKEGHKNGIYTEEQKFASDEIRRAGLSALARETLKIFNMFDGKSDASFKDVLKIIKQKKQSKSFTKLHQEEISQITNQILLKILQEMIKYLDLDKKDLEVDEYELQLIKSADSSQVEESYNFYRKKSLVSSATLEKSTELQTITNKYEMSAETTTQVEATTNNIDISEKTTEAAIKMISFDPTNSLNVYELFRNMSLVLSKRQWEGNLSNGHKQRWATILKDGKSTMAKETLKVLAIPAHNNDVTMKDVRSIIEKKKENGSLSEEKEEEIKEITREILLKMVQEIVRALSLTEDDLDMTADEFNYIVQLDTSNVEITGYKSDESSSVYKFAETSSSLETSSSYSTVVDYSSLFRRLSQLLNSWNEAGKLSKEQFTKWVHIVVAVQDALAHQTLKVLEMDQDDSFPVEEVINIIKEKRYAGGITMEMQQEIEQAAKPIIIKMVYDIIEALDLNINELNFSTEQLEYLTSLNTTFSSAEVHTESSSGETYQSRMKPFRNLSEKMSNKALLIVQEWFTAANITESEKGECFKIIKDCNSAFIRAALKLFNILDYSHDERLQLLAERKADMSPEELDKINDIGVEALVKMVQEIAKFLSLNEKHMGVSDDEFNTIMNLNTPFIEDSYDYYVQPGETSAAFEYKPETPEAHGKDELLEVGNDDLLEDGNEELLDDGNNDPLKIARVIKCNVLRIAGKAVSEFRESILKKMEADEVEACLETIGSLKFDPSTAHSLWLEVKRLVFPTGGITGTQMILLGSLLPTVAKFNLSMLDLTTENLEGISVLGRHLHDGCYSPECDFSSVPANVMKEYIAINHVDKFSAVELESFGQLLCGLTARDWDEKVTDVVFAEVHFIFNRIHCNLSSPEARAAVERKVLAVNQPPQYWTPSDVAHLGWLVGNLNPQNVVKMKPSSMEGVSGVAARMWTPDHWNSLTAEHIKRIGPHVMSVVNEASLPKVGDVIYFGKDKRKALRSAASEGTELMQWMDRMVTKMEDLDSSSL